MSRAQKVFLAGVALLMLFVVLMVCRTRQAPVLPDDEYHQGSLTAENCLRCHGPRGEIPQGRNHPVGRDCGRCHGTP